MADPEQTLAALLRRACAPPVVEVLSQIPKEASMLRREVFRAFRRNLRVTITSLAATTGLSQRVVRDVVDALVSVGAAELDGKERVIGMHGLTTRSTRHRLVLDGVALHTWCAIDAVGIPAAVEVDAIVRTTCEHCGELAEIEIRGGRAPEEIGYVLWFPFSACSHVVSEFCTQANLYCSEAHITAWRAANGKPDGQVLSLAQAQEFGRLNWSDVR